jgi:aminopeptidase 2
VRIYLKKFKYQNATTTDLWDALQEASGIDVAALMQTWTLKMGYPVVQVLKETHAENTLTLLLKQRRFLSAGGLTNEEEAASPVWWIPLGIVTQSAPRTPNELILTEKEGEVTFPYVKEDTSAYYKLNYAYTGLFRVQMTEERVYSLSKQIALTPEAFSVGDRFGLYSYIND